MTKCQKMCPQQKQIILKVSPLTCEGGFFLTTETDK